MKVATTGQRMLELLKYYDETQKEMAKRTEISESSLCCYISGKRNARQDTIMKIATTYKVNPAWLMGLDVSMFPEKETQMTRLLKYANLLGELTQDDLDFLDHQILYMAERRKNNDNQ